jgi:hypothetical protein
VSIPACSSRSTTDLLVSLYAKPVFQVHGVDADGGVVVLGTKEGSPAANNGVDLGFDNCRSMFSKLRNAARPFNPQCEALRYAVGKARSCDAALSLGRQDFLSGSIKSEQAHDLPRLQLRFEKRSFGRRSRNA